MHDQTPGSQGKKRETWNDETAEFAKQCHADGLSASKTAMALHRKFGGLPTRSSVCGFWWRHGLTREAASGTDKALSADRVVQAAVRAAARTAKRRAARISAIATNNAQTMPDTASFVPAKEDRKQLFELTNTTCRWPYGDPGTPDFFFCGDGSDLESNCPYCPRHMRFAYIPLPKYTKGYTNFLSMLGR